MPNSATASLLVWCWAEPEKVKEPANEQERDRATHVYDPDTCAEQLLRDRIVWLHPSGVYDLANDEGWVSVGDSAEFAVNSIRTWWRNMGSTRFPEAERLLITADAGGSNGYRLRAWKLHLAKLAEELGLEVTVCHYPPGTSKWNKIEHRTFSFITMNWRGRPLVSYRTIIELISATETKRLKLRADLDPRPYDKGVKVSDAELAAVPLQPHDWHGEWNYTIPPSAQSIER